MQYLGKSFSVGMNLGEEGRKNYDRIFKKPAPKKPPKTKAKK